MTVKCTKEQTREAGVWMTLLNSPDRSGKVDRGLKRWLAADPGNAKAFEAASRGWEAAGLMQRGPFPHHLAARNSDGWRWVRPAGGAVWTMAAVMALAVAGIWAHGHYAGVSTEIGEQRILTLKDGSRVFLNTGTRVVVNYDEHRRAVELKSGEAYFDVARRGPEWPFVVTSAGKRIKAVGTAFVVRRDPDRLLVTLVEGKVTVAPEDETAAEITLAPGQRLTMKEAQAPKLDEPLLEKVTSWRTGYLDLPVMPLSEAVAEMNRYSRRKIQIAEPASAGIPVSGVFRAGDTVSFANAVAESYELEVVTAGEGITLKKK